jgi:hypothetical protein
MTETIEVVETVGNRSLEIRQGEQVRYYREHL